MMTSQWHDRLFGVDDPVARVAIAQECLRRSISIGWAFTAIVGMGLLAAVANMCAKALFGSHEWQEMFVGACAIWVGLHFALRMRPRRALTQLPHVLAEQGRCVGCGYFLGDSAECPECGKSR